jgi:hypothetical protein
MEYRELSLGTQKARCIQSNTAAQYTQAYTCCVCAQLRGSIMVSAHYIGVWVNNMAQLKCHLQRVVVRSSQMSESAAGDVTY